ncbi:ABC transporter permease [Paludibacterium purpuratum]|uniref:Putative ABC transport system permease protein n=1 Tax=Paludibacterium purpuratum TaxID=1144873 RepID=A0A4R7BA14_9NEIS|nr:FtsX-like permease family protein [Paludibacterium purpuratum]TDR81413.1 putative ABC transport system permease protein [Paludibacterium purpuratum]
MKRLAAAWRFAWRELLSGELTLLALALLVAVCATSSVAFFADRVRQGLTLHANQLLAADLAIESDAPLPSSLVLSARQAGLQVSGSQTFPSMVTTAGAVALASLRAVPDNYPLRGEMRVRLADGKVRVGAWRPAPGDAWADSRLMARLGIRLGDRLRLGNLSLRLSGELLREPDGALAGYSFMPRLLFNQADVTATGLLGPGARARWRLMVSGQPVAVDAWRRGVEARLPAGARVESVEDARPELRSAMTRARRFLGLTAMLTATLAAAAMMLAVRRFLARQWQPVAVLRCLGLTGTEITGLFATVLLALALIGGGLGSALGYGVQAALAGIAIPDAGETLPPPAVWLIGLGPASALLLLIGLALPPVMALRRVPPSAVLRAEVPPRSVGMGLPPLAILLLIALSLWQMDDWRLAGWLLAGMSGYFLVAGGAAWCLVLGSRRLSRGEGAIGWRFGVAALARRPWLAVLQVVALSTGLMALLTLTVVRTDLLDAWRQSLPPDAPNQFVINLQPDQVQDFNAMFAAARLPMPEIAPIARGRLLAINGRPVQPAQYRDEQAQRLAGREFNLSWRDAPPEANRLVAGQWWSTAAVDEFSLEQEMAQAMGIRLGDLLTFDVAGTQLVGRVTSLRTVAWNSFRLNFFVLAPRAMLASRATSLVAAFYLPPAQRGFADRLVRRFANLTAVDVSDVLDQVREVIDRLAQAVEALFVLTLCAGVLVLWAALGATRDERLADAALMRALGASRRQLRTVVLAELLWLGGFTGLLAGSGAMLLGAFAGWKLLELPLRCNGLLPVLGLLCGMLLVPLAGWPLLRRVVRQTPLSTLQAR